MAFTVSVKTSTGQRHEVKVDSSDTVQDLKTQLRVQTGIPIEHMCITFKDKILEDECIPSECTFYPFSILCLWIRPQETGLTFTVKTEMETEHEVHMDSLDLVKTLKLILQEITQCPIDRQKLMFNGRQLEDDHPLFVYEIQQASVVHMMIHKNNDVVVIVETMGGYKRWFIDLNLCDTVKNLKAKIQDHDGIPIDEMQIKFGLRQLEDERTVSDCGIKHLSLVEVIWFRGTETVKMNTMLVKTSTGQRHRVEVRSSDTVQALKTQLRVQTGIPIEHMMCTTPVGQILEDECIPSKCGFSLLCLWIRPQETGLTFTVKTEKEIEHEVHMDSLDLVKTLKLILQEKTQCPIDRQKLMFNGRQLEDDHPLSVYEIQQASVVHMMVHKNNDVVVKVKQMIGYKSWLIDLNLCDTVKNLKAKIQDHDRGPIDEIHIFFEGEELKDERTVSDCGIKHLSNVDVIRFSGEWENHPVTMCSVSHSSTEGEEEEDKDAGEKRGRSISMDNLANFNH